MLRTATFTLLLGVLAAPATAQFTDLPRLGVSAAPDRYVGEITVQDDATFEVHVLVLGPDDDTPLDLGFLSFTWALLEACCGGAAELVDVALADPWIHEGSCIGGMESYSEQCITAGSYRLATLTLRMATSVSGNYWLLCGPINLAYDCAGEGVLMTDLPLLVRYANNVPVERATMGSVKSSFRD
jgi:hypothetical protein